MSETGKCLCGAVSFIAEDVQTGVHACHCTMCLRWDGGPALAVYVGSVSFNDESAITRYASSTWAERGFCKHCGSNLFYRVKESDRYVVWMGAFDNTAQFHLHGEIFIDEKPQAYEFVGDHQRLTGAQFMAAVTDGNT